MGGEKVMGEKKIFIGLVNLATMLTDFRNAFKKLGADTLTASHGDDHPADAGAVDYDFSKYDTRMFTPVRPLWFREWLRDRQHIRKKVWRKALKECDTFIFIWSTFNRDFSDYAELKKRGKKVITVFCGDDVRWHYGQEQELKKFGLRPIEYEKEYDYSTTGLNKRLYFLRTAEKYSDFIFSRLDQAQLQLRPYHRWNMMAFTDNFEHKPEQRATNPIIAHAPTLRKVKGTEYVLNAFEKLKNEGIEFTPLLIENVPNTKAIEMYSNADILIDQLIIPGTGKLATEGLALGKVVLAHMAYDKYPQKNPSECPIVDVNPDTLYIKLKELILDFNKRKEIALKGRPYVLKYLDTGIFCRKVLDLIEGKKIEYDYFPTFFRKQFIPESEDAKILYNQWTSTLTNCDWYKKHVSPGERAGLIF